MLAVPGAGGRWWPRQAAQAADKVTLQLKWVTQAQFAGYYVAKDKGFYKDEGLDVTIKPGGPDVAPEQVIAGGGADVIVDWMPAALAAREKGVPLVNIAQPFKQLGHGADLPRRDRHQDAGRPQGPHARRLVLRQRISVPEPGWRSSSIPTDGCPHGVKVLKQGFNVDPLLQKQADCISTMTYNEYWQVIDAGFKPEHLVVFKYEDQGVATTGGRPLRAGGQAQGPGLRGQDGPLREGLDEGLGVGPRQPEGGRQDRARQRRDRRPDREPPDAMMGEINKLTAGSDGTLDEADYERTVKTLLSGGSDPVISKEPTGAFSHVVTDKAKTLK